MARCYAGCVALMGHIERPAPGEGVGLVRASAGYRTSRNGWMSGRDGAPGGRRECGGRGVCLRRVVVRLVARRRQRASPVAPKQPGPHLSDQVGVRQSTGFVATKSSRAGRDKKCSPNCSDEEPRS